MQRTHNYSTTPSELLHFVVAGKEIRVVLTQDQQIWLVASDVAEVLGYQDASHVLDSLDSKNIRTNEQLYDENGNPVAVTFVNVMGCGTLAREAEPSAQAVFQNWVYQVLAVGTLHDLRNKANHITKPSPKKEVGFQTFVFEGNADVRVFLDEQGEPWFVAMDIAKKLGYSDAQAMTRYIDAEEKQNRQIVGFGNRGVTLISEIGMHVAISKSNKREAIRFQKWITKEVLPEIRRAVTQTFEQEDETQDVDFQIFNFENEQQAVRVFLDEKGNPWFVAKDICEILQIENVSQACENLKDFEKTTISNRYSGSNYKHLLLVVSESGFYSLVFQSRKPEAERFRIWVTSEVLPTIRKTGKYEMPLKHKALPEEDEEDFTASQLKIIQRLAKEVAQELIRDSESRQNELFEKIMEKIKHLEFLLPKEMPKAYLGRLSYVYLCINLDNKLSKVGKSNEPLNRMIDLQEGGSRIKLLDTIKFPTEELAFYWESVFQKLFHEYHSHGEWYRLDEFCHNRFKNIAIELNLFYARLVEQLERNIA
jgi:prophage antirepressor-like protein